MAGSYFTIVSLILLFVFALIFICYIIPFLIVQYDNNGCCRNHPDDEHSITQAVI